MSEAAAAQPADDRPPLPEPGDPTPPTTEELTDRATASVGFNRWIVSVADDERFGPLKARLSMKTIRSKIGPKFDRDRLAALLEYDEDLLEMLTLAEMEWRSDLIANDKTRTRLEIDTARHFDFRDPAMTSVERCQFPGGPAGGCTKPSVPGTVRCRDHGGALVDAVTRRAVLMTSYLQIVEATSVAVDALVSVASSSRNDLARVQAAKEILDRAGLTADLQVSIKIEGEERTEKIERLRERLDSMQRGLSTRAIESVARDAELIDPSVSS